MKLALFQDDLATLRRRVADQRLVIGALLCCLLLVLLALWRVVGTERIVLVPPHVAKTFSVQDGRASNEYLMQMGGFAAWLILDVTPQSIELKKQTLLRWCEPENAGEIKARQDVEASRLKKLNASTYFQLDQLVPDEESQAVVLNGRLRTQINGADTSNNIKSYRVQFVFRGGRIHLGQFKEVNDEKAAVAPAGLR